MTRHPEEVLELLERYDGRAPQGVIVEKLGASKATVSRLLNKLEEQGKGFRVPTGKKTFDFVLKDMLTESEKVIVNERRKGRKEESIDDILKRARLQEKRKGGLLMEKSKDSVSKENDSDYYDKDVAPEDMGVREDKKELKGINKRLERIEGNLTELIYDRLDAVEGEVEKLRELAEGNRKTYSMVTKGLMKLDDRLTKVEKLIAGALEKA